MHNTLEEIRRKKAGQFWQYSYKSDFTIIDLRNFDQMPIESAGCVSGRVMSIRDLNHIVFIQIGDAYGVVQLLVKNKQIIEDIRTYIDVGDFISAEGQIGLSQTNHKSLIISRLIGRSKSYLALPDKWHGLADPEEIRRKRYLDIIANKDTQKRFHSRFKLIKTVKTFFDMLGFEEVETPILQNIASGAAAKPFKTHHNALNLDLYLRIAPELYLKRLVVAGFPKIYEIAKCFRNEGIDSSHLQEFTMLEMYDAYLSYEGLKQRAKDLVLFILHSMDFVTENNQKITSIPVYSYREFLIKYANIDPWAQDTWEKLRPIAIEHDINPEQYPTYFMLLEKLYKVLCVSKINSEPVLVYDYPSKPLAMKCVDNENFGQIIQVIMEQKEIINAYMEQNDPDIQQQEFEKQILEAQGGNDETVAMDKEFIEALSYGLPPTAGLGMGIDRLIQIITKTHSIRDVIFFPTVKNA